MMNTADYIEAYYAVEVTKYPSIAHRANGYAAMVGMLSSFIAFGVSADEAQSRIDDATAALREQLVTAVSNATANV